MRVLVLDDDLLLRTSYARRLRRDHHAVDEAASLAEARDAVAEAAYDTLVIDRVLPDGEGLDLLADLPPLDPEDHRPHWTTDAVPALVISALGASRERIVGLQAGAADYVPKPVRLEELSLRVGLLLQHPLPGPAAQLRVGPVVVDQSRREVTVHGEPVTLTPLQLSVFEVLAANQDRLVSSEELILHCWDRNDALYGNPVHSQISRLRKVFEGVLVFEAVRGAGYRIRVLTHEDG